LADVEPGLTDTKLLECLLFAGLAEHQAHLVVLERQLVAK
jgi:hypothetical protein